MGQTLSPTAACQSADNLSFETTLQTYPDLSVQPSGDMEAEKFRSWQLMARRREKELMSTLLAEATKRTGVEMEHVSSKLGIETYNREEVQSLKETFAAFASGVGEMDFTQFENAWQYLNLPKGEKELLKTWDIINIYKREKIREEEFIWAIMGQRYSPYSLMGDLEHLTKLLEEVNKSWKKQNRRVQETLDNTRREIARQVNDLIEATGFDKVDYGDASEIMDVVAEAFKEFDGDVDGCLDQHQFCAAWRKLKLHGKDEELTETFDNALHAWPDRITFDEFLATVMAARSTELTLIVVMKRLKEDIVMMRDNFQKYKAGVTRRRGSNHDAEARIAQLTQEIKNCLVPLEASEDDEKNKMLDVFKQTFEDYDADGNGELDFTEFLAVWTGLDLPGTQEEIFQDFCSVDVERSGYIEKSEFLDLMVPREAKELSTVTRLELIQDLVSKKVAKMSHDNQIRARLADNMPGKLEEILCTMSDLAKQPELTFSIKDEIEKLLDETFSQFDTENKGYLESTEFLNSWEKLGFIESAGDTSQVLKALNLKSDTSLSPAEFKEFTTHTHSVDLILNCALDGIHSHLAAIEKALNEKEMNSDVQNLQSDRQEKMRKTLIRRRAQWGKHLEQYREAIRDILLNLKMLHKLPSEVDEKRKLYMRLHLAFNAFDSSSIGELSYAQYCKVWATLNLPGTDKEIKSCFDSVDVDGHGYLNLIEFSESIMQSDMEKFAHAADIEEIHSVLAMTREEMNLLRGAADTSSKRGLENSRLRSRLDGVQDEIEAKFGEVMSRMAVIMGKNPEDLLTSDEIEKLLNETFKKFDVDDSGLLDPEEFRDAFRFLNLKGSDEEIDGMFESVDTDNSGEVDRGEFVSAIQGSRLAELNLGVVLSKMDGHLDNMQDFYDDFHTRQEEAKSKAAVELKQAQKELEALQETAAASGLQREQMQSRLDVVQNQMDEKMGEIMGKIMKIMGQRPEDILTGDEIEKLLNETFNEFDTDDSGLLDPEEFRAAFRYLGLDGSDTEIDAIFKSVDTDHSGRVDRHEFASAVEESRFAELNLSVLLTKMDGHVDGLEEFFNDYHDRLDESKEKAAHELAEAQKELELLQSLSKSKESENDQLTARMEAVGKDMDATLGKVMSQIALIMGDRPEDMLTSEEIGILLSETFKKFDEDDDGTLDPNEFREAFFCLGLKGTNEEIESMFKSVDTDNSGRVDANEFSKAIQDSRFEELNLGVVMSKMSGRLENLQGFFEDYERRLDEAKSKAAEDLKEAQRELVELREMAHTNMAMADETRLENEKLRARMESVGNDMDQKLTSVMEKMGTIMGHHPEDLLTEEEIDKLLTETFNKFDENENHILSPEEFREAFRFLGLKGTDDEINAIFESVDGDNNGCVDFMEFEFAIRDSRLEELSLELVMSKMDGHLDKLDGLFDDYKNRLEDTRTKAEKELREVQKELEKFESEADSNEAQLQQRLEEVGKQMEQKLGEVMGKISAIIGQSPQDLLSEAETEKLLKETFKEFDQDNSSELDLLEFREAFRSMGLKGSDSEIDAIFKRVDTDDSNLVNEEEFITAIKNSRMNELNLGLIVSKMDGRLESLENFFDDFHKRVEITKKRAADDLLLAQKELKELQKLSDSKQNRLQSRLHDVRKGMDQKLGDVMAKISMIIGKNPEDLMTEEEVNTLLSETFAKFDTDENGTLDLEEFRKAFLFMGLEASADEIDEIFQSVDVDNNGVVDHNEFSSAILESRMAELNVGVVLSKMDSHLEGLDDFFTKYRNHVEDTRVQAFEDLMEAQRELEQFEDLADTRKIENDELRARLEDMKSVMDEKFSDAMKKMTKIMGHNPENLMSGDEIDLLLEETFKKFDSDHNGHLDHDEFREAFQFLGLKGTDERIDAVFISVDVDNDYRVDLEEFKSAIKEHRSEEMNLRAIVTRMDGHLDGLEGFFNDYHKRVEDSEARATEELKETQIQLQELQALSESQESFWMDAFSKFETQLEDFQNISGSKEGRLNSRLDDVRKGMDQKLGEVMSKISMIIGKNPEDLMTEEEVEKLLSETFSKFDTDQNGTLDNEEFREAFRFMGLEALDEEIDEIFQSVDVDNNGVVDHNEFSSAILESRMAELNVGVILSKMDTHLEGLDDFFSKYRDHIEDTRVQAFEDLMEAQRELEHFEDLAETRRVENDELRLRMSDMKRVMDQKFGDVMNKMARIIGQNPEDLMSGDEVDRLLEQTFKKFDSDHNEHLDHDEFRDAFRFLGLKGTDESIDRLFRTVDVDNDYRVDLEEFKSSIKESRSEELNLRAIVMRMDGHLDGMKDFFSDYRKRVVDNKLRAAEDLQEAQRDARRFQAMSESRGDETERLNSRLQGVAKDMNQKFGEAMAKMSAILGANPESLMTEREVQKLLDETFKKFDTDQNGTLDPSEFRDAFRYMGLKGSDAEIDAIFQSVDLDHNGCVDQKEFSSAVQDSRFTELNLGVLLDKMDGHLDGLEGFFNDYKDRLSKTKQKAENDLKAAHSDLELVKEMAYAKDSENDYLRQRLRAVSKNMNAKFHDALAKISTIIGRHPEDILTDKEVDNLLIETFMKFDADRNGTLDKREFADAFRFMGLQASETELDLIFQSVDEDCGGTIDADEFVAAIRESRAAEMSLGVVMSKMDGNLENLQGFFADYKHRLEMTRSKAADDLMKAHIKKLDLCREDLEELHTMSAVSVEEKDKENAYLRERLEVVGKDMTQKFEQAMKKIALIIGERPEDLLSEQEIETLLNETFRKFDTNRNGTLDRDEFGDAFRFMGLKGTDDEIDAIFESVDVDHNGCVDREEFSLAVQDSRYAELNLGVVMDKMEGQILSLEDFFDDYEKRVEQTRAKAEADLKEAHEDIVQLHAISEVAHRKGIENDRLHSRLEDVRSDMNAKLGKAMAKMMTIMGNHPEDVLTEGEIQQLLNETFKSFDTDNNGKLDSAEFREAFRFMGLKGEDSELDFIFDSVDIDDSGYVSQEEFSAAVQSHRYAELNLGVLLSRMDGHVDGLENFFDSYRDRLEEARVKAAEDLFLARKDLERLEAIKENENRRRNINGENQAHVKMLSYDILNKFRDLQNVAVTREKAKQAEFYNRIERAFHIFDKDDDRLIDFSEYKDVCRFLNISGNNLQMQIAFDKVDINQVGQITFTEFALSLGVKLEESGVVGYLEEIELLLDQTIDEMKSLRKSEKDLLQMLPWMSIERNKRLLMDEEKQSIVDSVFTKYDIGDGSLSREAFKKAWRELDLGGSDTDLEHVFDSIQHGGHVSRARFFSAVGKENVSMKTLVSVMVEAKTDETKGILDFQ